MPKLLAVLVSAGLLLSVSPVFAQSDPAADYPNRLVKIIVSVPPGGGVDIVTRIVANKLQQNLGQSFIIENHAGAGGNLGTEAAAASPPDGYTLVATSTGPMTTSVLLYKKLNFKPEEFEPLAIMTSIPNVLVVRADHPANSVAELIAYAKANPGKVNFGSQGVGTTPHLTAALFAHLTGTQLTHVPYRGTAQVINDLLAGHLDLLFMQLDAVKDYYLGKKIKMLAVTTEQRVASVPDVPTAAEAGLPGFRSDTWNLLAAPPKTPPAIVAKLNRAINEILREPDTAQRFRRMNMEPIGGSPADIRKFIRKETVRWGEVIRAANITAD